MLAMAGNLAGNPVIFVGARQGIAALIGARRPGSWVKRVGIVPRVDEIGEMLNRDDVRDLGARVQPIKSATYSEAEFTPVRSRCPRVT